MRTRIRPKRSPGRPAAGASADARELLLTAATDLIAEQGIAATTFAMIAKRAGLTPAMMHYYFRDRDHLLDCVVEERLAALIALVWDPVGAGASPAELIAGIVDRLLTGIERMPWIPSTWMREVLNEGGLLRNRVLRQLPFEKLRLVSDAVMRGQSRRVINPEVDPVMVVFSTIGLVMLHSATADFFAETFHRKRPDRAALWRHITALLLNGLDGPGGKRTMKSRK